MIKQLKLGKMIATKTTNIIFWGTPNICLPYLNQLHETGYCIKAVVTLPDRKVGRKQILNTPPPKIWAEEHGIEILQPEYLDESFVDKLKSLNADISIVVAYGKILPQNIIDLPSYGTLNVHYSLLPLWRGSSPVESAILAGDTETGVSIQKMVFALDAGDIVAEQSVSLLPDEYAYSLKEKLSLIGAELLLAKLPDYLEGFIEPQPQNLAFVTKAPLIKKSDGEVKLKENEELIWKKYRAYTPWPGIFFFDLKGKRIKITKARFENKKFVIEKIIPEGRKEISWEEYKKK